MFKTTALTVTFTPLYLYASAVTYPGLFGVVVNLAKNDRLNIREKPDWHTRKVGSLSQNTYVGIEYCK